MMLANIHDILTAIYARTFAQRWNDVESEAYWQNSLDKDAATLCEILSWITPEHKEYNSVRYGFLLTGGKIVGLDIGTAAKLHYGIKQC